MQLLPTTSTSNQKIRFLLLAFAILKLMYIVQTALSPYPEYNRLPLKQEGYALAVFSNNDSGWYEHIADVGYPTQGGIDNPDNAVFAFFPMYPMLGYGLKNVLGISPRAALFCMSTLFSYLSLLMLFWFVREYTQNESIAFLSVLVFMLLPHNFYVSMIYSESTYLFFLLLSFYTILKRWWILFTLATSVLILTRINASFSMLSILVFYLGKQEVKAKWYHPKTYFVFVPMLLALSSYLLFMKLHFGSFFAFKEISEKYWNGQPATFLNHAQSILQHLNSKEFFESYNLVYAFLFLSISIFFLVRKQYAFFLLTFLNILLPLYEGSVLSQNRFISVLFPFSFLLATVLKDKPRSFQFAICIFLLGYHLWTFQFWIINDPMAY